MYTTYTLHHHAYAQELLYLLTGTPLNYPAILQAGFCVAYCLAIGISGDNLTMPNGGYSIVIHSGN